MSDTTAILHDTANRLFSETVSTKALAGAAAGEWLQAAWQQLEELGLTAALIPEDAGGAGLEPADALGLVRLAGYHGLPLPLAETLLAGWLLAHAGLPVLEGPLTFAPAHPSEALRLERAGEGWRLRGELARVPWARHATAVAALADHDGDAMLCLLTPDGYTLDPAVNLAGEPRDTLQVNCALQSAHVAPSPEGFGPQQFHAAGAALRALAMAGAVDRVLTMSVNYANERKQFGRPIGKFQAVQQNLAVLASQAAAAGAASDIAAEAFGGEPDLLAIAVAKIRTGEAAGSAASIAHQVHGAIGFTEEHSLHFFTKRLWSWRDEFGREADWIRLVGQQATDAGAEGLWPLIASV